MLTGNIGRWHGSSDELTRSTLSDLMGKCAKKISALKTRMREDATSLRMAEREMVRLKARWRKEVP